MDSNRKVDLFKRKKFNKDINETKMKAFLIFPIVNLFHRNACPVKEEVVAPFWANNTRGEVLALLNLYPFEQYVHWEKCTQEHKQMYCRDGCRWCVQKIFFYLIFHFIIYSKFNLNFSFLFFIQRATIQTPPFAGL